MDKLPGHLGTSLIQEATLFIPRVMNDDLLTKAPNNWALISCEVLKGVCKMSSRMGSRGAARHVPLPSRRSRGLKTVKATQLSHFSEMPTQDPYITLNQNFYRTLVPHAGPAFSLPVLFSSLGWNSFPQRLSSFGSTLLDLQNTHPTTGLGLRV